MLVLPFATLLAVQFAAPMNGNEAVCSELAAKKQLKGNMTVDECVRQLASVTAPEMPRVGTTAQVDTPLRRQQAGSSIPVPWIILGVVAFCLHAAWAVAGDLRGDLYMRPLWTHRPTPSTVTAAAL